MFGKGRKKLDRRMRRRIRKTSAVMLLISAIVVAAIPVPDAVAADGDEIVAYDDDGLIVGTKDDYSGKPTEGSILFETEKYGDGTTNPNYKKSKIPYLDNPDEPIYSSESDIYRFACERISGQGERAILLGVSAPAIDVDTGAIKIPETVDAYVQYTNVIGSTAGFAAANTDGHWLYYKTLRKETWVQTGTREQDGTYKWGTPQHTSTELGTETEHNQDLAPILTDPQLVDATTNTYSRTLEYYRYKAEVCYMKDQEDWSPKLVDKVNLYALAKNDDYSEGRVTFRNELENYEYYDLPTRFWKLQYI